MAIVSLPKELLGVSFIRDIDLDTGVGEIKLPDNATPEQKKAFVEYQKQCEQAQQEMCVIE